MLKNTSKMIISVVKEAKPIKQLLLVIPLEILIKIQQDLQLIR